MVRKYYKQIKQQNGYKVYLVYSAFLVSYGRVQMACCKIKKHGCVDKDNTFWKINTNIFGAFYIKHE